jgi:hypothetical protein
MSEFTSVDRADLQLAFVKAHRASELSLHSDRARKEFKEIAELIWKAHGEQGTFPTSAELEAAILEAAISHGVIAQRADTPGQRETQNASEPEQK